MFERTKRERTQALVEVDQLLAELSTIRGEMSTSWSSGGSRSVDLRHCVLILDHTIEDYRRLRNNLASLL